MRSLALAALGVSGLAAGALAQSSLTINTPGTAVLTCVPLLITWSGGQGPYWLDVNAGGSQSNVLEPLFSNRDVTQFTWVVDLPPQSITLAVRDSSGAAQFSSPFNIQQGPTDCLNSASASGAASSTATPAASSDTSDSPSTEPASSSPAPSSSSASSSPASSSPASSSPASSPAASSPASSPDASSSASGAVTSSARPASSAASVIASSPASSTPNPASALNPSFFSLLGAAGLAATLL